MCQPEQQFHLPLPKRVNVTGMKNASLLLKGIKEQRCLFLID
jgi:hypothetical protein